MEASRISKPHVGPCPLPAGIVESYLECYATVYRCECAGRCWSSSSELRRSRPSLSWCCVRRAGGRGAEGWAGKDLGCFLRCEFWGREIGATALRPDRLLRGPADCLALSLAWPVGGSKAPPDSSPAACLLAIAAFSQYWSSDVGFPNSASVGISRRHRASGESPSDPRLS